MFLSQCEGKKQRAKGKKINLEDMKRKKTLKVWEKQKVQNKVIEINLSVSRNTKQPNRKMGKGYEQVFPKRGNKVGINCIKQQ